MLLRNELDYYDLDLFNKTHVKDINNVMKMVKIVIQELTNLGWKCKLVYGDTGLFIYSTEHHFSDNYESIG
jgi:hypothetical protein